jgi:hypothetical protein
MLEVDAERITARFRSLVDATIPNTEVETLQSFVVESGRPGAVPA